MKKVIFLVLVILNATISFGQNGFNWEKIDSVDKDKNEIYSLTKMYVSETWKSAQDVIQNDDKDGGVILVKGLSIQSLFYQLNEHKWIFSYTVKFMFKEKKYKIIIDNVYCQSANAGGYEWPHMTVSDSYPEKGLRTTGVSKERYFKIMNDLKNELQGIVDGYSLYLNNKKISNSEW